MMRRCSRLSRLALVVLCATALGACVRRGAPTYVYAPVYAQQGQAQGGVAYTGSVPGQAAAPAYAAYAQAARPASPPPAYQPAPAYQPPRMAAAPTPIMPSAYATAQPAGLPAEPYLLDSGDRLRVQVFGQEGLSNTYVVDAAGNVALSLIGTVPARGLTTGQFGRAVAERLRQGYIREPHVSVEIEAYRPFFILGEVNAPGQYPYVANMTAESAVAIAGGYAPRADKRQIVVTRNVNGQMLRQRVPPNYPVRPGDTVTISERWL